VLKLTASCFVSKVRISRSEYQFLTNKLNYKLELELEKKNLYFVAKFQHLVIS